MSTLTAGSVRHRPLPYPVLPVLRAANGAGLIHPDDRRYGTLLVGGQGSGKTAAMLRTYLNDIRDHDAAVVVLDPKSELSHLCLQLTPPDTPKRVWFLDLGHPAFGMSPLRLRDAEPLPLQATAIADNIVAALLDINENQIFQSSRRYLYHAVIGALALAAKQHRRARFEDVYQLLLPAKADARTAVYEACADTPDLDQTAEFFRSELPQDLQIAGSATAQRLDAPRNKVSGLTGVPPLRRFFNHTSDVALSDIVDARDILIVDANMAAIGAENSKACMHFVLRMLHTQLQRQVRRPETDRPRVALLADEAHYIASAENVVDQIATHRAAGLDVTFGLQYLAQLGAGSEHEQKIRKGIVNLLQSRLLFRLGDHEDAEDAVRIAMAVYTTMIRDDPDSRARLRVTPEQILNLPVHHCLASWIAGGTRAASFIGQTFPFPPDITDTWAQTHRHRLHDAVGPYPEALASTLTLQSPSRPQPSPPALSDQSPPSESPPAADNAKRRTAAATAHLPDATTERATPAAARSFTTSEQREGGQAPCPSPLDNVARPEASRPAPRVERIESEPAPQFASPVLRVVGRPARALDTERPSRPAPESLRELAFIDRINEIKPLEHKPPAERRPRLYDTDYAILALLDRAGLLLPSLIGRAVLPGKDAKTVRHRLSKLYGHGLVARAGIGLSERTSADGRLPAVYSLTRFGLELAQQRTPPAVHPQREWKPIEQRRAGTLPHNLHAISWAIELHRVAGELATDYWRTPRYATGRYPVPQTGNGHKRHPITAAELDVAEGHAYLDLPPFREIKPDLSLELRIPSLRLTFDLLVELDLTARPSYNQDKLRAYDAFLTGWTLAHPRYRALGTRPVTVFVFRDRRSALACAREADRLLTGRVGQMGTAARDWYYAGRQHLFFAAEPDIHRDSLRAFALPPLPSPSENAPRSDADRLAIRTVELLPPTVVRASG
ncbi:type IV secretion system DNA-binding domain-containing protein [Solirubrobacter soli]|uniref:type IV secretion system DNA-binding domain-containing protein n=1 Tax=Solirubrobacter soli TaxID=363832 RepID=UPI000422C33C|nr:type IV secretion system DNA-binding domain-containing protein [Solirubrobacter soli]